MDPQPSLYLCLLVLLFCTHLTSLERCEGDDRYIIIIRANHNYALDASDAANLTIRQVSGVDGQLWKFQPTEKLATYYIVNEKHGKVLDIKLGSDNVFYVFLNDKKEGSTQQHWNYIANLHSGLITNYAKGTTMHVYKENITPDGSAEIALWEDTGCQCQKWILRKKE